MSQREYERRRKADYRARNKERLAQEKVSARERERIRALPDDACCCCCGEERLVLLADAHHCWNCRHAIDVGGNCPHAGHGVLG